MMTPVGTFFGVLFVLLFLAAVTSNGALKGPDAFALRWTVITLAVAISGFAAWLRSRPRSVRPSAPVAPNATQQLRTGAADVEAAGRQAIVFRRHFPPRRGASALSFFGGAPIAPRDFRWPRPVSSEQQSKPFSFLMQIDCAAVPAAGRLGMLPDRGVLYFFHDLTWKQADVCRVIYADAQDIQNWRVVDPPDDLGLAFGDKATFSWKWTQSLADGPKLLPKWTFDPVVVELPPPVRDPEEGENAPIWWPSEKVMAERLRAVTQSIEASLVESEEAAARIPADVALRIRHRHALTVQTERGLGASTPDRMLAPPVDVQGHQWDRAKTHLLLLELSSNDALGHHWAKACISSGSRRRISERGASTRCS